MATTMSQKELVKYIEKLNGNAEARLYLAQDFNMNTEWRDLGVKNGSPVYKTVSGSLAKIMSGDILRFRSGEEIEVT